MNASLHFRPHFRKTDSMLDDETRFRLLKQLHANPDLSQRELAQELGISVGKVNYCMRALVDRGWVKARNFRDNPKKKTYAYLITPKGMEEKAQVTLRFLKHKVAEYETLQQEIQSLRAEVQAMTPMPIPGAKER